MAEVVRLPGQPPILHGLLNLRGSLVPVVFLRHLLGLPASTPGMYTPLIVVKSGSQQLALVVDQVIEVREVNRSSLKPLAEQHSLNNCAQGEFENGEGSFVLLNADRLLLLEEQERLRQLASEGMRRLNELEASQ